MPLLRVGIGAQIERCPCFCDGRPRVPDLNGVAFCSLFQIIKLAKQASNKATEDTNQHTECNDNPVMHSRRLPN